MRYFLCLFLGFIFLTGIECQSMNPYLTIYLYKEMRKYQPHKDQMFSDTTLLRYLSFAPTKRTNDSTELYLCFIDFAPFPSAIALNKHPITLSNDILPKEEDLTSVIYPIILRFNGDSGKDRIKANAHRFTKDKLYPSVLGYKVHDLLDVFISTHE